MYIHTSTLNAILPMVSRRRWKRVVERFGKMNAGVKVTCLSAARQLSEKSVSTASAGDCKVTLVSPQSRVQPKEVSIASLEKAARSMLKACSDSKDTHDPAAAAKNADPQQVAMLLSKAS
ncbi:hypothetical protein PtB15_3B851 [Puccinia triticina]|nr:hypothetical protein PtB15_3B851 [Puccinia triticina]